MFKTLTVISFKSLRIPLPGELTVWWFVRCVGILTERLQVGEAVKYPELSLRTVYVAIFVFVCLAAVGSTVWLVYDPNAAISTYTNQVLLLAITVLGLFPETRTTPAFLSRSLLIQFVIVSAVINIGCFAFIHRSIGVIDTTGSGSDFLLRDSLYFSIVTFTTLGFGDIQPLPSGRLPAAFQALSGYIYLGFGIGLAVAGFRPIDQEEGGQNRST
ncbi:MAG: potassium channel family protein [Rhodobacteraceae bacterium]|nr:potassium channel family protein [Paracoccaceae bacterium]